MITTVVKSQKNEELGGVEYLDIPVGEYVGQFEEKALSHSYVMDTMRKLMGKTLTLIDASIVDKTQNKSIKDIIRGIYSDEIEFLSDIVYNQEELCKVANEHYEGMSEKEILDTGVTVEEILGVK